jgi:hypothetical protein
MVTLVGGTKDVVRVETAGGCTLTCWLRDVQMLERKDEVMVLTGSATADITAADARLLESMMVMLSKGI